MRVWRLARAVYPTLDGEGARLYGGRWNSPGRAVVYGAGHLSLCVLELLVHVDPDALPEDLTAYELEIPDAVSIEQLTAGDLPGDWRRAPDAQVTRVFGDAWLADGRSAVLAVPSAIIPEERNYLINPAHPDAPRITVLAARPFVFDPRLLGR